MQNFNGEIKKTRYFIIRIVYKIKNRTKKITIILILKKKNNSRKWKWRLLSY